MMTWLEAVPSSRSRPKRSKNPSLGKRTWQWTNTLRQKCGSMLGTWVCWIEISKSLIFTVTEFEITFTSNDNFQTWTNAIYKGLPELSPKEWYPTGLFGKPSIICNWGATCNAWMHKRCTTMQLNNVEIWNGSSLMKSPGKKTYSTVARWWDLVLVLSALLNWNKQLKKHQKVIDS